MATEFTYDFKDLAKSIFGVIGYRFPEAGNPASQKAITGLDNVPVRNINENTVQSYLGTPIVQPIWFKAGTYKTRHKGQLVDRNISQDYLLPGATIADFNRGKEIVKTKVQGRTGTIKEYISHSDYQVGIRGVIASEDGQSYPEQDVNRIKAFEEITDAIRVQGGLFDLLGIYNIVIVGIRWLDAPGFPGIQPFTMECISDEPAEIKIINRP